MMNRCRPTILGKEGRMYVDATSYSSDDGWRDEQSERDGDEKIAMPSSFEKFGDDVLWGD
jgi:hypothetical protein